MFEKRWNRLLGETAMLSSRQAWNLFDEEGFVHNGAIDLRTVNRKILTEDRPEKWEGNNDGSPKALISTIHKSKGLEFPHVLVLGAKSDSLLKRREEARIFYVALTRAQETLAILERDFSIFPNRKKLRHDVYRYQSPSATGAFVGEDLWDNFFLFLCINSKLK
jgi:superfamily I DNA/RNA helicase